MKTPLLLISFLCMFASSLQAQVQHRKALLPSGPEQVGIWINPAKSGLKPDHIVVPAKRNMFNPSNSIWKWDTIHCYDTPSAQTPFHRVSRTYNSLGLPLTQISESRQDGFTWENFARETFTWDSAGNWLSYLAEQWQNNAWVNSLKQTFVYNSDGNMVDWKRESWQSTYWAKGWHYTWHYNSTGLNDTSMYQTGQDSLWVNCELGINSYDTNDFVASVLVYAWANNNWVVSRRESYTHDSLGNYLTSLAQNWQIGSWMNYSLSIQTFDTVGHNLTALFQLWQNNTWVNIFDYSYIYDSAGNMLSSLRRNGSGNFWENSNQNFYVYDGGNNLLSITYQNWNVSYWKNTYQQQYTYDSSGNSMTGKYLKWYAGDWHPEIGSLSVYADHQQDKDVTLPNLYRYSAIGDSVMVFMGPILSHGQVTLYPNPAHSMIYVSSPATSTGSHGSLTLYDLRGQLILTKQIVNETTGIDVSGLKPGVYFVRFSDDRGTKVLKLVKE